MSEPDRAGEIGIDEDHKAAFIRIAYPDEIKGHSKDTEWIVVHELLHMHTHPFCQREDHAHLQEDQAIEALTFALLNGK